MAHQGWIKKLETDYELHELRGHDPDDKHYFDPFELFDDSITEQFRQDVNVREFIRGALTQSFSTQTPSMGSFALSTYRASFETTISSQEATSAPNKISDFKRSTSPIAKIKKSIKSKKDKLASYRVKKWRKNVASEDIQLST